MSEFAIRIRNHEGVTVVAATGRLDTGRIGRLEEVLTDQIRTGVRYLVVDCTDTTFIASSALRVFLLTHRKLREAGVFIVAGLQPPLLKMVRTAGFDTLINVRTDVAAALGEAVALLPALPAGRTGGDGDQSPATDDEDDGPWRPEVGAVFRHALVLAVPAVVAGYYWGQAGVGYVVGVFVLDLAVCFCPVPGVRAPLNRLWRSVVGG